MVSTSSVHHTAAPHVILGTKRSLTPFNIYSKRSVMILFMTAFVWKIQKWKIQYGKKPFLQILACYIGWLFIDRHAASNGGKLPHWRSWKIWDTLRTYYPATLIKTCPLNSSKKYIFACHPHGLMAYGLANNIIFRPPADIGVLVRAATIPLGFFVPGWRELLHGAGYVSVEKESCRKVLENGDSLAIVVGGAAESMHARPGSYDLVLEKRKGFIKLALQSDADLIPVITFGENDLYKTLFTNPKGSWVWTFQTIFKNVFTFTLPLLYGRFGTLMPFAKPLTTVLGTPLELPHLRNPTIQQVDFYHDLYKKSLRVLFDAYKDQLDPKRVSDLYFVDESSNTVKAKL